MTRGVVLLLGLLIARPSLAHAQAGSITGRVTDARSGAPIDQVQVSIVGTTLGGLTNADGRYTIRAVPTGSQQVREW